MTLRFGLYVPTWSSTGGEPPQWLEIQSLAKDAEALGIDSLWVADEPGFWESWTVLTAIAAVTATVDVGPLVACTRYRDPALLVTMVRALDEVAGGRLILGLGAGVGPTDRRWPRFGWDGTRHVARFAEAAEIIARLLRDGPIKFDGEFYRVDEPDVGPSGPRSAGPPIWVAAGKPRTMEVAARWADAVNFTLGLTDVATLKPLVDELEAAADRVGRTKPISRTGWARLAPSKAGRVDHERPDTIAGTFDFVAERILALHAAGIEHLTCFISDGSDNHPFPRLTAAGLDRMGSLLDAMRHRASGAPPAGDIRTR